MIDPKTFDRAAYLVRATQARRDVDEALEQVRAARIQAHSAEIAATGVDLVETLAGLRTEAEHIQDFKARLRDEDRMIRIAQKRKRKMHFRSILGDPVDSA